MPLNTSRISTSRVRPPGSSGGIIGSISDHCSSVRSDGYDFRVMQIILKPTPPCSHTPSQNDCSRIPSAHCLLPPRLLRPAPRAEGVLGGDVFFALGAG